jgi:pSer/pThr/pTyr-binding forkhead associated (FHA) protein
MDTRTSSVIDPARENLGTYVAETELPALAPKAAFIAAYPRLVELAACAPPRTFGVVAVDAVGRVAGSTLLGDDERVVIGRHTACDLRLHEGAIALRHLVALLRYDEAGPSLHAWELATGSPFLTEAGVSERALRSTGPLYLAIHGYALWLLPLGKPAGWPASAEAAFHALPPRTFVEGHAGAPKERAPVGRRPAPKLRLVEARHCERTQIASLAPPLGLADDEGDLLEPFGVLAIARSDVAPRRDWCAFSAGRLERGVLLGRYDRCDLLGNVHGDQLSRVHALLVRLGDDVVLLDTASTNGTFRGRHRITACVLHDGDRVAFSSEVELVWRQLRGA